MAGTTAVIFDMYETLVINTSSLWIQTFDDICQQQKLGLTGRELWDWWKPIELVFRRERLCAGHDGNLPPFKSYRQAWMETFQKVFDELGKGDAKAAADRSVTAQGTRELYPESATVLARLKSINHLRLGLLSNADEDALWPLLRRHSLEFDGVVSSESATAYKPLPQPFLLIAEALGVPAQSCIFVGDSLLDDAKGAKDAGMRAVWVNRRGAQMDPKLPAPDFQVKNLMGLQDILGVSK